MNVLMLSPGFPQEQAYFTRALARTGTTVVGLGDQGAGSLPPEARDALAHYEQVQLADRDAVLAAVDRIARHLRLDRVECLWEPYVVLAAQIREHLGIEGMTVQQARTFRDKELMKQVLDEAGIRTPRHTTASDAAGVRAAAERIGYPLIIKPLDGAGSADTYRVGSAQELATVLPRLRHVATVSVEEFVDGEEFTYDTVCAGGRVLFENVCHYRPRPLLGRSNEWISPMTVVLREHGPEVQAGLEMGRAVLDVLGFRDGFSHMEWYRKHDGEVVFGEIGARPPGARTVDAMNYAADDDLYRLWAEATAGTVSHVPAHRFNSAIVYKRAQGNGRISRVEGLEELQADHRDQLCVVDLLPVGAPRRDWRATLISDGVVIARDPDLATLLRLADRVATDLRIYAG
ncbi:ATP-grasp domain-containing protein [Ornithinimicrobium tianjinense]|uniref:Carboxylate--amine ligase n=1 Tax=Ornithinimicrobium tianjinense TaxID=1195761 RepID=A0A917F294_9MICO|nr:ATP-grasp domain-containing protein [Ornithinimicrobium tianjinense]GGF42991.1 carboxylate--amine ligase [Ornithinimicrobium tianjinense]